jgi:hypothetical protein
MVRAAERHDRVTRDRGEHPIRRGRYRCTELWRKVRHCRVPVDRGDVPRRDRLIMRGRRDCGGDRLTQPPGTSVSGVVDSHLDTEPLVPPPRYIGRAVPVLPLRQAGKSTGVREVEGDRAGVEPPALPIGSVEPLADDRFGEHVTTSAGYR